MYIFCLYLHCTNFIKIVLRFECLDDQNQYVYACVFFFNFCLACSFIITVKSIKFPNVLIISLCIVKLDNLLIN